METLPPLPDSLTVPEAWPALAPGTLSDTVLLVGTTDTGKSTLARWLLENACRSGRTAAWLDADLGQSSLGIPGTLNLVIVKGKSSAVVERVSFFVGSTSPRGHMLQILTGLRGLRDRARSRGADPIFIDTTGLVAEEAGGGALKEWEVELLQPAVIVALQRARELEHLLAPWRYDPRLRLHLLPVAAGVRRREPEERAGRRQMLFGRYFDESGSLRFYKGSKPIYGLRNAEPGCLAGLIDREGFLLGAAVVREVLPDGLHVVSPWNSSEQVVAVRVGKLRIDPLTGMELHHVGRSNTYPNTLDRIL
ncbi:MAG TPA: polynucleotide 5'-hydroxyl-kinase [Geobacteraceae bacterium]|nr:polynucleotide 5'-hydroxyl-kinase [Geobacteraceae bacterium]